MSLVLVTPPQPSVFVAELLWQSWGSLAKRGFYSKVNLKVSLL